MRLERQTPLPLGAPQIAPENTENTHQHVAGSQAPEAPIPLAQDHYHRAARPGSLLGDQRIRLLNNIRDIVTAVEPLIQQGDSNQDGRLSPAEFKTLSAPPSSSPEQQFTHKAIHQKLQRHWQILDRDQNGLDTKDLEHLQRKALSPDPHTYTLAAVPVHELSLVESTRALPPVGSFQLTPMTPQPYTFESRHQSWDPNAVTHQSLTENAERFSLNLSTPNSITVYYPQQLPEAQSMLQRLAEAASRLPVPLQHVVHSFELNPLAYTFEVQQGAITRQADMTASPGGKITLYPQERTPESFYRTLIHESAHLLAFEKLGEDTHSPGWESWLTAMEQDRLAPSQYARINGSAEGIEDFAEAVTAWVLSRDTPEHDEWRALMPARFAIIDGLLM